jgi:hypothetical protein
MHRRTFAVLALVASAGACATPSDAPSPEAASPAVIVAGEATETHLTNIRQITFGGENAEAYWSANGEHMMAAPAISNT